jgi:hypothetical protein
MHSRNLVRAPPTMWSLYNLRDAEDLIWGDPLLERHIVTKYSSSEVSLVGLVDTLSRF